LNVHCRAGGTGKLTCPRPVKQDSAAVKDMSIKDFSDHSLVYLEVQRV
jgi:hypothetical protein